MLGYAWVGTFVEGPNRIEHRPWEQLQATFRFDDLALALRSRLEQRFSEGELGWRPRQLVRLQQTLTPDVAAVVWDEIFVGLNATSFGQPSGLDQNRLFVGPAWTPLPRDAPRSGLHGAHPGPRRGRHVGAHRAGRLLREPLMVRESGASERWRNLRLSGTGASTTSQGCRFDPSRRSSGSDLTADRVARARVDGAPHPTALHAGAGPRRARAPSNAASIRASSESSRVSVT